jgi:DNA-binding transcriptional ArsR family regulator
MMHDSSSNDEESCIITLPMDENAPTLFGSRRRSQVLLFISLMEETHPREIASALSAPLRSVQNIVQSLEDGGYIVSRTVGRLRRVSLNRRYFAYAELEGLLRRMVVRDEEVEAAAASVRRRPRRAGKEL